ncbi:hypothetical protein SBA7_100025 [Candidatus Sulfotelmatobacter sp. SbA7]|nr:hypothetical protein SBA7_100025 [Candidatus Sulfotelmatobacter sp. SbA7]
MFAQPDRSWANAVALNRERKGKRTSPLTSELTFADRRPEPRFNQAEATVRFPWKQSRHNTGRPWVGRKGTVVDLPHCEQVAGVSILGDLRSGGEA